MIILDSMEQQVKTGNHIDEKLSVLRNHVDIVLTERPLISITKCPGCHMTKKNLSTGDMCLDCKERIHKQNTVCIKCKASINGGKCPTCDFQKCIKCCQISFLVGVTELCCICYGNSKCSSCHRGNIFLRGKRLLCIECSIANTVKK